MSRSSRLSFKIGPSILNADLSMLGDVCVKMHEAGADYLHLDVMDGCFVPNLTFGHPLVKCLRPKVPKAMLEVHMMVAKPKQWIEPMADAGANMYTFHVEATGADTASVIRSVKESGMKVGLSLKPGTVVGDVFEYVDQIDQLLVMSVEPGFGGQSFMVDMLGKVKELRDRFPKLTIGIDGGVKPGNIEDVARAGTTMIVCGSAITDSSDYAQTIRGLKQQCANAISFSY